MENVERKVLELFRELEGVYPKEHWFWIYTCLKRWYYYWYHLRSEHFAKMNDNELHRRVSALARRFAASINHHIHRAIADWDEVQAAFRDIEQKIGQIIEEEAP